MSDQHIEYLDPTSHKASGDLSVPAISDLKDKVVGFLNNGWSSFGKIGAHMESVLLAKHGIREMRTYAIPSAGPPAKGLLDRVAEECDVAVVGMAN
jgi:hypothetical protein